jgi:type I restriction enzyme S subunit
VTSHRPKVRLGELLRPASRPERVDPAKEYALVGVRLDGKGPFHRETILGSTTSATVLSRLQAGDFIYSRLFAWRGAFGIVGSELDGHYVSGEFPTFLPADDRLDLDFLRLWFRLPSVLAQVIARSSGSTPTTRNRLREDQFLSLEIPFPPLDEQRRIVARLDRLASLAEDLALLQESAGVQIEALLGAHLNTIFGDPYRETEGTIGSDRVAVLGDVALDVADGPHKTPSYVEEGVPFVTVLNITTGRVSFQTVKYISEADHREYQRRARAERGDVLITKDGTIGIPCYVDTDREFSFFVSVALVKPRRELLDGQYLSWVLRAPYLQARMRERSRGDMIRHLVLREIRAVLLPLPELDRQRQLVEQLQAVESIIDSFRRLHEERTDQTAALLRGELARSFA